MNLVQNKSCKLANVVEKLENSHVINLFGHVENCAIGCFHVGITSAKRYVYMWDH